LLDVAKGYFAVWLAAWLTDGSVLWLSLAASAVLLGHCYPIFLKFHGGKAVACFIGAFLYLTPVALLAVLLLFVIVVAQTRHISLGSIISAGLFPLAVWLIEHPPTPVLAVSVFAAILIVYRHKSNLERLQAGTESVFLFQSSK
jgi:glycerol-3-phosphate acyltransferase PlsY